MNQVAKRFVYQIEDRDYIVEINSFTNNQPNLSGFLISVYHQGVIIGEYQFFKNIVSYEFFGSEEESVEYLFDYTKGFIVGWDKHKRSNFKF